MSTKIRTVLKYYSFTKKDYLQHVMDVLNNVGKTEPEAGSEQMPEDIENTAFTEENTGKDPLSTPYAIPFRQKEKAPKRRI